VFEIRCLGFGVGLRFGFVFGVWGMGFGVWGLSLGFKVWRFQGLKNINVPFFPSFLFVALLLVPLSSVSFLPVLLLLVPLLLVPFLPKVNNQKRYSFAVGHN